MQLQGSINPMLSDFGEATEARQYSGRAVEDDWRAPFAAGETGDLRASARFTTDGDGARRRRDRRPGYGAMMPLRIA